MPEREFILTGGFLDGSSEGFLGRISLDDERDNPSVSFELIKTVESPDPELRIKNKGFAGASIHNGLLWVCASNQVLAFTLKDFELKRVINDPLFNDLHHVLAEDDGLYIVNTGLESLDYFDYGGVLKKRTLLTSDTRTEFRTKNVADFRIVDSNPHFMHANHCARRPDGHLLITFLRQRRIVDTANWDWGSPLYDAPPHEGFICYYPPANKNCLWVTTVPGSVIACDPYSFEEIARWSLPELGVPIGWTRGLRVLESGFLVGATKIIASNADYFSDWSDADVTSSQSQVTYVPFDSDVPTASRSILDHRVAKIFSIVDMSSN